MVVKSIPYLLYTIHISRAVSSSTAGYRLDINPLQLRHLPFNIIKLNTGISSSGVNLELHMVHLDPGHIIDSFRGILYIHTFRKLPINKPTMIINKFILLPLFYREDHKICFALF